MEFLEAIYFIVGIFFTSVSSRAAYIKLVNKSKYKERIIKTIPSYIKELTAYYERHVKNSNVSKQEKQAIETILENGGILSNMIKIKIQYGDSTSYDIIKNTLYIKYKKRESLKTQTFNAINKCILELVSYKLQMDIDVESYKIGDGPQYYEERRIREVISIMNKLNIINLDLSLSMEELARARKYPSRINKKFKNEIIFKIKYSEDLLLKEAAMQITESILKEIEGTKEWLQA